MQESRLQESSTVSITFRNTDLLIVLTVFSILFFYRSLTFQQVPAQKWMGPSMGGNSADRTAWAMRFTSCATPAMNWWDQRAGFVRKAWPGAGSSPPAEVKDQCWFYYLGGHFPLSFLLILFPSASLLSSSCDWTSLILLSNPLITCITLSSSSL